MSDGIPEEVMKLSYEEMQSRFEYYLQEWEAQRDAALRTFTASLLFISVAAAVVSIFPDRLLFQYSSQPASGIWTVIGTVVAAFGITLLMISLMLSLLALQEIPRSLTRRFPNTIPDAMSPRFGEVEVNISDSTVYPQESEYQWYRTALAEYTKAVNDIRTTSSFLKSGRYIRWSHGSLYFGITLLSVGTVLSV